MGYIFTQYSNKSGVDVSVVQSTGTSKVDVMSQDATTRELNSVKQAINKSASALLELQNGIITPVGSFQTDSSVAYVKDVPENALPRAELKKVGGITKKTGSSTNLLPYPYPSNATTIAGITFTDRGDGSIKVSGTAEDYVIYVLATEGSVNFGNTNMIAGISFGAGDGYVLSGGTDHVTLQYFAETRECLLTIAEGVTVDDEVVYPMVNTGLFPEIWEPYKAPTLYTAKATEVESVGVNLFDISQGISSTNGCEVTIVDDSFSIRVTGADPFWFMTGNTFNLPKGEYYFYSITNSNASNAFIQLWEAEKGAIVNARGFFTVDNDTQSFHMELERYIIGETNIAKVAIYKVQRNEFIPYVNHTLPIPVEVRGSENLIPYPYELTEFTLNGISVSVDSSQKIIINGTCTGDTQVTVARFTLPIGTYTLNAIQPNAYTRVLLVRNGSLIYSYANSDSPYTFNVEYTTDDYRIDFLALNGGTFSNSVFAHMLNEGTTALPYEPYSTVKGLDGYGLGVSDTVYNYIDWEKKQFMKRCAMVDLGTLGWAPHGSVASLFEATLPKKSSTYDGSMLADAICSDYNTDIWHTVEEVNKQIALLNNQVRAYNTAYTDAAAFKAAMSGVMLVYELATPEVTDISQYITDDDVNIMKVGAGGTITFKNGYAEAVPSEIEYQVGA